MLSLLGHCHGEKTHFSRNEKRTFSLSQMNNVELAWALSWRENALFEKRKERLSAAKHKRHRDKKATTFAGYRFRSSIGISPLLR